MWKLILFNLCSHKIARLAGPLKNGFVLERARATWPAAHNTASTIPQMIIGMRDIYVAHNTVRPFTSGNRCNNESAVNFITRKSNYFYFVFVCVSTVGVPSPPSAYSSSFYFSPELMDLCCVPSHGGPNQSDLEKTALMRGLCESACVCGWERGCLRRL